MIGMTKVEKNKPRKVIKTMIVFRGEEFILKVGLLLLNGVNVLDFWYCM